MKYDEPNDIWDGITPCQAHLHHDSTCDACGAEMTARSARVDQMSADSSKLLADIQRHGGPGVPPEFIMQVRLEVLIDSVIIDPKDRMKFEGEVGRRVMRVVKDVHAQTTKPQLHVPPHVRPRIVKDTPQA